MPRVDSDAGHVVCNGSASVLASRSASVVDIVMPMRDDSMLDDAEFDRWHEMALDAAATAEEQVERHAHHWACFLAEQASQFICKGLLHGLGRPAWGHDLVQLGERIRSDGEIGVPDDAADALARLSRHYIATRYPDAHPAGTPSSHYRASDAQRATEDARLVIGFIEKQWTRLIEEQRDPERLREQSDDE